MNTKNKRRSIALGLFLALAIAAGAYAYWTNSGSGAGSATTGNPAGSQLTVNQVGSVTNLRPGGAAQDVDVTVTNGSDASVHVSSVSVSLAGTTWQGTCSASDYSITGSPATVSEDIAAGATSGTITTGIAIAFNNTGSNQDDCKGQALVLSFTAN
jgi:hypothetical protein